MSSIWKETVEKADELLPVARPQKAPAATTTSEKIEEKEQENLDLQGIRRAFTGATLVEPAETALPDLTPPVSDDEVSEYGASRGNLGKPKLRAATVKIEKASTYSAEQKENALSPSPLTSGEHDDEPFKKGKLKQKHYVAGDIRHNAGKGKPLRIQEVAMEVVKDATKQLSNVRQKEQSARPLRIVKEGPTHTADETLKERFEQLAEDELRIRRLNTKDWLRVATWCLLKLESS
ncbi:MAG: hypothetical protein Q9170_007823 [Blastenia crenularia]